MTGSKWTCSLVHMNTAALIRDRMEAKGLTVAGLASASAIARVTLTRRLADPSTFTIAELCRVASVLDLPVAELIDKAAA